MLKSKGDKRAPFKGALFLLIVVRLLPWHVSREHPNQWINCRSNRGVRTSKHGTEGLGGLAAPTGPKAQNQAENKVDV